MKYTGRGRVTADPKRCEHDLLACKRCRTLAPGQHRFYPTTSGVPRQIADVDLVPNRGDRRRRGGGTANYMRGARRRAQWDKHPLGLPTDHGRTIRPVRLTRRQREKLEQAREDA